MSQFTGFRNKTQLSYLAASALLACTAIGCGKTDTSGVSIVSKGYATSTALRTPAPLKWLESLFIQPAFAAATGISGFKFCITQMKLDAEDGSAIKNGDSELLEAKLGLVNLGDGSQDVTWGNLNLPTGVTIKRIKIEIHKDAELCGVPYSTAITDTTGIERTISKNVELKFLFSTPKTFATGDSVSVSLTNIVNQYSSAVIAGKFNDENIGNYLESYSSGSEDSAK